MPTGSLKGSSCSVAEGLGISTPLGGDERKDVQVPLANQVGGFNPIEKYDRQIGSFPQVGMKIKNI